jgi:hypothetical protein
VRAWDTAFKGEAAGVLIDTIANYLDKRRKALSMQTCFVNSSGTGKSRIVHEVAAKVITVPMCLRLKGTQGFTFSTFCFRHARNMIFQDSLLLTLISVIG